MASIVDYVEKYSDCSFCDMPFNEVDNLIFSQIIYNDFSKVVSGFDSDDKVSLSDASNSFFNVYSEEDLQGEISIVQKAAALLRQCANTKRFGSVQLSKYVNNVNERIDKQFSAINCFLNDGTLLIAFRGTDTSLTGIKESAMLSYMFPVPAQIEALYYFQETSTLYDIPVRVCGHSKGGNLAVFAAVSCSNSLKKKILAVYEDDAPGFPKEFLTRYDYLEIKERIFSIIPEKSIIGCLLEHDETMKIVKSENDGLKQHQVSSWQIDDKNFIYADDTDEESKFIDKYLKKLMQDVGTADIETMFNAIFDFFENAGIKRYEDIKNLDIAKFVKAIGSIKGVTEEQRHLIEDTLKLAVKDFSKLFISDRIKDFFVSKIDVKTNE